MTSTPYTPNILVTPAIVADASVMGTPLDGDDTLSGGAGVDVMFGGSQRDVLDGGDDADYVDAGSGNDVNVTGGRGDDVVRGGAGDDAVRGGEGIDQVYGDAGDDSLFGDAGTGSNQTGQRLFGGAGRDSLFAFAPTASSENLTGDQLLGGAGSDFLYGNVRRDILVGGAGNDYLDADSLAGSGYVNNAAPDTNGASDTLLGEGGEDRLIGGGGDDSLWGGSGTDILDGRAGSDTQYGGSGIDLFVVFTGAAGGDDVIDGHYANSPADADDANPTPDDNATDILVINGTGLDDTILVSESDTAIPRLRIDYSNTVNRVIFVDWRNAEGTHLVEQLQVNGFGGNDNLGFAQALSPARNGPERRGYVCPSRGRRRRGLVGAELARKRFCSRISRR